MKYLLALDQGTTSSRALLVSEEGKIVQSVQREIRPIFPSAGWVEQDPEEIWTSQKEVAEQLLQESKIDASVIVGIGIANQRETTLVWERNSGKPLGNAIVWQDRRTSNHCQALKQQGLEPLFQKKTGLLIDPYFSGTKLHWILKNYPGAFERAKKGELAFGTVDSWLVWKLSQGEVHITDVTNASRTLLYNIHTLSWDEELLELLQIPRQLLPEVRSSSEIYAMAKSSFLPKPVPICGIAGDQQAALFGQGCTEKGLAKSTYGTGCFMLLNTGDIPVVSSEKMLTTIAWQIGGRTTYALEGSVFIAGAVVQWLRDNLGVIPTSSAVEKLAESVPDSGGVYFVPAFTGLGAPYWDPYAKGAILGLTRGTTAAHIARAALEGIAFQATDLLACMRKDAGMQVQELRVDGGAVRSDLLMQLQADLTRTPVLRPNVSELTALGAAYLAGLALDIWKNPEELKPHWNLERRFEPSMSEEEREERLTLWKRAIACSLAWEEHTK